MHSRQSSGISVKDFMFGDELKKDTVDTVKTEEEKVNIDYGNIFYKTKNGGVIKSVQPPSKASKTKVFYKVRVLFDVLTCI